MSDEYKIDSQKISLHPERVTQWIVAKDDWEKIKKLYPIYVEIAPIGACNHRCTFCSVDYLGYKTVSQNEATLISALRNMAQHGVKSVMFAGEGEPALWKPLPNVLEIAKDFKLDFAMTTNMVPFTKANTEKFVANCSWIKASINAGTKETYESIHQTKASDFDLVMKNFQRSVEIKHQQGYECTLGAQILLLPENKEHVISLAQRLKDIGADYLVIKPYTQSLYGISHVYEGLRYDDMMYLKSELDRVSSSSFKVVFRDNTMIKLKEEKQPYDKCYSTPAFWGYIMADGSVYSCGAYLGNENFNLGNINDSSFSEIWEGEGRKHNFLHVRDELSIENCRKNCRMDEVNRYLWELKHPSPHVNFI